MSSHGRLDRQAITRLSHQHSQSATLALAKLVFAIGLFLLIGIDSPSDSSAQTINWPLPVDWQNDAELTDVCAVDASNIWVVGQRGLVLHSIDGGKTWRHKPLVPQHQGLQPITCSLESVVFTSPANGWIAGGFHNPQSTTSKGIVFRTTDGGNTWTELPADLPWIKQLFFANPQEGYAIGQGNTLKPGGIFRTYDGGQSWASDSTGQPQSWQSGNLHGETLVLSPVSDSTSPGIFRFANNKLIRTRVDSAQPNPTSPRHIQMMDDQYGFAVGDHRQFLETKDGGMTWQDSPMVDGLPDVDVDFRTMAIEGNRLWVAGDMGRRLFTLHSDDKTWRAIETPSQTPINKLTFSDELHGWAIAAGGSIINTVDGGVSWQQQRIGGKGVAILQVANEPQQLVPELFGRYCADQPYIGAGLVVANGSQTNDVSFDRARAAMMRVNASFLQRHQVIDDQLNECLVRQIRSLQPRVIAVASSRLKRDQVSLRTAVLAAVNDAADFQKYPQINQQLGLEPWTVGKVVIVDRGDFGDVKLSANHYIPGVSALLTDYTMSSRMLLNQQPIETRQVSLTKIYNSPFAAGPNTTLFGNIENFDAAVPKRSRKRTAVGNLVQMRLLAAKSKTIGRYLKQAKEGATPQTWSTGLSELSSQLDDASSGVWLYHLARSCETNGHLELAAETHLYLSRQFRKHPLSTASLQWLFHHFASAEHAHLAAKRKQWLLENHVEQAFHKDAIIAKPKTRVQDGVRVQEWSVDEANPNGKVKKVSWTSEYDTAYRKSRFQRARSIMQSLSIEDETCLFIGRSELSRIGLNRKIDQMVSVEDQLKQLALKDDQAGDLLRIATLELRIIDPRREPHIPPAGTIPCSHSTNKPHLDGDLNDEVWKAARFQKARLAVPRWNENQTNASDNILIARDDEFLYLAIDCQKLDGFGYTEKLNEPRQRDEDLTNSDRIELLIDIDRDFETYYSLSVDWRGRVADSLGNNLAWDPTWYVATSGTAGRWTAEIAIPLSELSQTEFATAEHWAISATRHIRNQSLASSCCDSELENGQDRQMQMANLSSVHGAALTGKAHQNHACLDSFQIINIPAAKAAGAALPSGESDSEQAASPENGR